MTEPSEAVEGQSLAQATLTALDSGDPELWAAFVRAYHDRLLRMCSRYLKRYETLRRQFDDVEALLNDFLARKVFPEQRARSLLGPSARGERPLCPRLFASLG